MLSEEGISQYEILLTTGGFITSDPLVYISGYQYSYDGKNAVYGYKLQLNDDGSTFTVLEEGVEIGEFVCLNGIPFVPQKLRNFPAILKYRKIQTNPL